MLRAKRWVWHENKKLEVNDVAKVKESTLGGLFSDLITHSGEVPVYWYSWIPNLARASLSAIEIIKGLVIDMSHPQSSTQMTTEQPAADSNKGPSIFISYSHEDEEFTQQLYQRLRNEGFDVWYAAEDMKGGQTIYEQIDKAINRHDRLLLVLSETSMNSAWVRTEIRKARRRARDEKKRILFPISLVPFSTIKQWECFDSDTGTDMAVEIREFFIPDFQDWKDAEKFSSAFVRLVSALSAAETEKVEQESKQIADKREPSVSLVQTARELAQRVRTLPDEIVASFSKSSPQDRVNHVSQITSRISWDAIPLITWIERNRPLSADLEKRRFAMMEDDAVLCAKLDIPEYRDGVVNPRAEGDPISDSAKQVATLLVFCIAFENALLGWAEEIERIS